MRLAMRRLSQPPRARLHSAKPGVQTEAVKQPVVGKVALVDTAAIDSVVDWKSDVVDSSGQDTNFRQAQARSEVADNRRGLGHAGPGILEDHGV
jgi:hypothetical protein